MSKINLLNMMSRWADDGQKRLTLSTDNLSRAAIPGEKEKLIKDPVFKRLLGKSSSMQLSASHSKHMGTTEKDHGLKTRPNRDSTGAGVMGNNINSRNQLRLMEEAYTDVYAAQTQYATVVRRLKMVLNGR